MGKGLVVSLCVFCLFIVQSWGELGRVITRPKVEKEIGYDVRIHILLFHFGTWGPDFRYWLHFARANPQISYTMVTDANSFEPYAKFVPPNVHRYWTSLKIIAAEANEIMQMGNGSELVVQSHYKLCDYRPLFGKIYAKVLDGLHVSRPYTHWGWGDFDVLMGNVFSDSFFPGGAGQYLRGQYDVISTSQHVPTNGPFTVMLYNSRTTNLYKYINFRGMKHKTNMHCYLDALQHHMSQALDENPMKRAVQNRSEAGELNWHQPPLDMECNVDGNWLWLNGEMFRFFRNPKTKVDILEECGYTHFGGGAKRGGRSPRSEFFGDILGQFFDRGYFRSQSAGILRLGHEKQAFFFSYVRGSPVDTSLLLAGGTLRENETEIMYNTRLLPVLELLNKP